MTTSQPTIVADRRNFCKVELWTRDGRGPAAETQTSTPPPSTTSTWPVLEGFDVAVRFFTCASPAYLARCGRLRHPRDLLRHECLLFRDPRSGRPFVWEFHRPGEAVEVKVSGRLVLNELVTKLTAGAAGHGIAQAFEFGLDRLLASGELVQILAEWADERFLLYAYHPSRHLPPAKVRAFLDFVLASIASPTPRRRATACAGHRFRRSR